MLPTGIAKIYLYGGPADLRRGYDGLSALVSAAFPGELSSGALFVFVGKRRRHVKILYWDGDGFVIWQKRLESGTFGRCFDGRPVIGRRELAMLLEGVTPRRLNRRYQAPKK